MSTLEGTTLASSYAEAHRSIRKSVEDFWGEGVEYDILKFEASDVTEQLIENHFTGTIKFIRSNPVYEIDWRVQWNT